MFLPIYRTKAWNLRMSEALLWNEGLVREAEPRVSVVFCCPYKVNLKELGRGRQQSWVRICITLSIAV